MPIKIVPFKSPHPSGDFYIGFSLLFLARNKINKPIFMIIIPLTARNAIKPSHGERVKMVVSVACTQYSV